MAVQLRYRHPPASVGGPGQPPGEEGDQPQGQPHLLPVREHGGRGAASQGAGHPVRAAVRGGRRHQRGPDLLPRPRRLHDRDLQLRQPPRHPPRRPRARDDDGRLQARGHQAAAAAATERPGRHGGAVRAVVQRRHPRRRGGAHLVRVSVRAKKKTTSIDRSVDSVHARPAMKTAIDRWILVHARPPAGRRQAFGSSSCCSVGWAVAWVVYVRV